MNLIQCVMVGLSLVASAIGLYLGLTYGWSEIRMVMVAGGLALAGVWACVARIDHP